MKVNERSKAVQKHEAAWGMIEALLGGTAAMRKAKERYLPKWPGEEQDDYDRRLAQSTLYPALKRTLSVMVGKPFAEPIVLQEDMPDEIKELCEDIDLEGNNLHTWSAHAFYQTLAYGLGGILVDFPVVNGGSGARTKAEEKAVNARPYFVHIPHSQILGWRTEKINGKPTIIQLRLMETVEEPDGPWGTTEVPQVRVLEPGKWSTYREAQGAQGVKEWVLYEEGVLTLPKVPFVPLYGTRCGFMDGEPPLIDLAHLNVKHWQSQSDQDNILHVARVPILFIKGRSSNADGDQAPIRIGQQAISTESTDADMKFVEHTGKAIEAGEKSLEKLEDQMVQTGAELLVRKPGSRATTATQANNEAEGNKSDLQRCVEGFEDSIDQALAMAGEWMRLTKPTGHIKLFSDFGAWSLDQASGTLIKDLAMAGLITKETALLELQRRSILSADIDPATELDLVEEQGPMLGGIGDPSLNQPPGGKPDPKVAE